MLTIGPFALTAEEVAKRKAYLEIADEDERLLRKARPVLQARTPEIIDRFYEYLLAHDPTRAMLSAPGLVERLKALQTRYFDELTSGDYGIAYFENRLRVGQVHHRIGLSPEWYLGAYVKYLHIASDILRGAFGVDDERFYRTLVSLTKVIYLDMGLALDAYRLSGQAGLRQSNEELRRLQAAKKQLTDMIVHDLQSPLSGISSALQVLSEKAGHFTPSERDALEEALSRCRDLSQMILNVLQVSRAEEGSIPTYFENVDLAALAREVAESFRRAARQGGRRIELEVPDRAPARTDQTLVSRILQNLIRNALRHTPSGTTVVVRAEGRELSVRDDGPGIPPEIQPRLFGPFEAAALREADIRVDTGLGLPSCQVMARALGARLDVESDGKSGTRFTLSLPETPP